MAEVFSTVIASEQHPQWLASQYVWDPSQLQALPLSCSQANGSEGSPSEPGSEGHTSSTGGQRQQSLGPIPVGWQGSSGSPAGGSGGVALDARETKSAHFRPVKGPLVCQVEGCGHDLSVDKGYYQRYRVCEPHVKVLSIMINDRACRFCQQCGRFHELSEFDGNKRSCRARLLQHNARRRKRDPFDTAGKEQTRKGRPPQQWPENSNDAETSSRDVRKGAMPVEKVVADSRMDPCFLGSGTGAGDCIMPTSNGSASAWSPRMQPSMVGLLESSFVSSQDAPMLLQPSIQMLPPQQQQQLPALFDPTPCLVGGSDLAGSLDDVLDDLFNGKGENLVLPAAPSSRDSSSGPSLTSGLGLGPGLRATNNMPGGGFLSVDAQALRPGGASSNFGPNSALLLGSCNGASLTAAAGGWGSAVVSAETGGNSTDMSAALERRNMEQLQLQQQQQLVQHEQLMLKQQQLLQQQQQQQMQQQQQLLLQQQQLRQQQLMQHPQPFAAGGVLGPAVMNGSQGRLPQAEPFVNSNSSTTSAYAGAGSCISGSMAGPCSAASAWTSSVLSTGSGLGNVSGGLHHMGGSPLSGPASLGQGMGVGSVGAAPGMSSFELARRLVASGGAAAQYKSEDLMVRVSIKIANCTPDQLPPDLYQRLRNLLNTADASLVQGFLRPGCTHLVLDVLVSGSGGVSSPDEGEAVADGIAALGLSAKDFRGGLGALAARSAMLVQTEGEVASWPAGMQPADKPRELSAVADLQAAGQLPVIAHVTAAAHLGAGNRATLAVFGTGLAGAGVELFARMQGGYLPVKVQPLLVLGKVTASASANPQLAKAAEAAFGYASVLRSAGRQVEDVALVTVEEAPGTGLLLVEAQSGPLLSNWRPCLLSTDADVAAELSAWGCTALRSGAAALASLEAFVTDLGRVLDRRSYCEVAGFDEDAPVFADASSDQEATFELVCMCERLLAWAADAGLARVSSFLVAALRQYGQDVQAILEAPYADGLTIVHRCIRSRNAAAVVAMMGWAAGSGIRLSWDAHGALGLSPLHLAALVPATWRILAASAGARGCWESVKAHADGGTPKQLQTLLLAGLPPGAVPRDLAEVFTRRVSPAPQQQQPHQPSAVDGLPSAAATSTEADVTPQKAAGEEKPVAPQVVAAAHVPAPASAEAPCRVGDAIPHVDAMATVSVVAQNVITKSGKVSGYVQQPFLLRALHTFFAMLFAFVAVLFAAKRSLPSDSDDGDLAVQGRYAYTLRLAPVSDFVRQGLARSSSSLLGVALLGLAVFVLPVKSAAMMLSQLHPASTCMGAP
ncbi:hypothetical protein Agub_g1387 [Astrephomene gubernaculifera]|uniref:SBP-type domain-containing protein n=1 Tax=Astrephomene gubernaculifera TaxID=47775 RepID=A0AAD3HHF5_9CHLO|nr:hypothetical protein Agub_g1387 [Astrephomene gubernaculifera]